MFSVDISSEPLWPYQKRCLWKWYKSTMNIEELQYVKSWRRKSTYYCISNWGLKHYFLFHDKKNSFFKTELMVMANMNETFGYIMHSYAKKRKKKLLTNAWMAWDCQMQFPPILFPSSLFSSLFSELSALCSKAFVFRQIIMFLHSFNHWCCELHAFIY